MKVVKIESGGSMAPHILFTSSIAALTTTDSNGFTRTIINESSIGSLEKSGNVDFYERSQKIAHVPLYQRREFLNHLDSKALCLTSCESHLTSDLGNFLIDGELGLAQHTDTTSVQRSDVFDRDQAQHLG